MADQELLNQLKRLVRILTSRDDPLTGPLDAINVVSDGNLEVSIENVAVMVPSDIQAVWREEIAESQAPLGSGATFLSAVFNGTQYAGRISGSVFADQAGTLTVEQSSDNASYDNVRTFSVVASTAKTFSVPFENIYARVRYVNGGTVQGAFRLSAVAAVV
jgi:hypothetical protein